jgi:hypothetical protein
MLVQVSVNAASIVSRRAELAGLVDFDQTPYMAARIHHESPSNRDNRSIVTFT